MTFFLGKVRFLLLGGGRGGVGRGILEFFCEKSRGPPTSRNGLMHDPSEIPKQKHLTLPPTKLEVLLISPGSSAQKVVNCVACDCAVKT